MRITMDNFEHPTQENYEHQHLSVDLWVDVIDKAKQAEGKDLYLYILRSWANQQVVSNASICAFRGQIVEDVKDRQSGSNAIGQISKFVRSVTGNPKATCYEWNTIRGEWTIGTFQTFSLRKAFGASRAPKGSEGIS